MPAPLRVEPLRAADVEVIMPIEREVYPFPWTAGNFLDSLRAGYDLWLFRDDVGVAGYAVLMWLPDEVHLLNFSVAGRLHRQGWGTRMLRWLCHDCATRGARAMLLEVRPSNVPARCLYERFGFRQVGVRRRYYPAEGGQREDALVMQRALVHG